jgi:hypothetical protein
MFAPHCTGCARRVLLGTERIVRGSSPRLVLRCHCGELLAWDQRPPTPGSDGPGALAWAGVATASSES